MLFVLPAPLVFDGMFLLATFTVARAYHTL